MLTSNTRMKKSGPLTGQANQKAKKLKISLWYFCWFDFFCEVSADHIKVFDFD